MVAIHLRFQQVFCQHGFHTLADSATVLQAGLICLASLKDAQLVKGPRLNKVVSTAIPTEKVLVSQAIPALTPKYRFETAASLSQSLPHPPHTPKQLHKTYQLSTPSNFPGALFCCTAPPGSPPSDTMRHAPDHPTIPHGSLMKALMLVSTSCQLQA